MCRKLAAPRGGGQPDERDWRSERRDRIPARTEWYVRAGHPLRIMQIKLLSWNIWHGKHLDDVIAFLKTQNADIIALQEVVKYDDQEDTATQIAKSLGYSYIYYKAFYTERHTPHYEMGNAILSRFPIQTSQCHFLSTMKEYQGNAATEPRIAVEATIEGIKVFSVHLAYSENWKSSEMRMQQIEKLSPLLQNDRTVLMGDMNGGADLPEIQKISEILKNADANPITPTHREHRIDHIFVSTDINVKNFEILDSKASDHLPITAILEI